MKSIATLPALAICLIIGITAMASVPVHAQQAEFTINTSINANGLLEVTSFSVMCYVCENTPCTFPDKLGLGAVTIQTNGASSFNQDFSVGVNVDDPARGPAIDVTAYTCQMQLNGNSTESFTPQPNTPLVMELTGAINQ